MKEIPYDRWQDETWAIEMRLEEYKQELRYRRRELMTAVL